MIIASPTARRSYVDVFRGLLIAHMALDHASLTFNAGRGGEELAATAAPAINGLFQFLTRFTGVPVAPGFFFMAGFMVALTSAGRAVRGVPQGEITRRLIVRGLVLIAVDAIIMGLPRAAMGFYSFMVLTCIGVGIIALALLRHLPSRVLLAGALAVLFLHPLLDVSALPVALRAIIYEPVRTGTFRSLYPIVPWAAIVVLGFVVGRDALTRERPARLWSALAAVSLALFLVVRLAGGYGNAYGYSSVASLDFWMFAKYPPDLAFLTWSFACVFLSLAALATFVRGPAPALLRPFETFGRVPFFFYVVHFYVLGIAAAVVQARFGLLEVYGIWLLLLLAMLWPCAWYYRKKQERPNGRARRSYGATGAVNVPGHGRSQIVATIATAGEFFGPADRRHMALHKAGTTMKEEKLDGVGGLHILARSWRPEGKPRGVVAICHGFNSHSGHYFWVAEQLVASGLAVYALDLRGRGKSDGERFWVDKFSDYLSDVHGLITLAKQREPGLPVFLLGHSAGGVISCVYALEHPNTLAGLVCESFAFQVPAPDFALAVIKGLSHLAPHAHVLKLPNEGFSRDPKVVAALNADPLIAHEVQPTHTVAEMVRADERLKKEFPLMKLPVLIMHGTMDKVTRPEGSQFFYDTVGSPDRTLKLYEGYVHDLLNDVGKEAVIKDIRGWIAERIPPA